MPEIRYRQVTEGGHAGRWTFSVDGKESLYYAPTQAAAERKVNQLRRVAPKIKGMEAISHGDRLAAFMRRGKLATEGE